MNINILKSVSVSLSAAAYDIDADIARMEGRPESVAHYVRLAGEYRTMAATYRQWADEDEKRIPKQYEMCNAERKGAK